ncbi:protein ImuB [Natronospira proteinivora]|uniref:Protein ImuB n=1 Tax=Natronospira proteinivora TaxID=1807133 RepID=A0ABT1G505_9GAMM|nr:DNA polymerase Y family protein [Natronospira proteinivora]MCP1726361.1 protein ImuB [Natronospira proteinivora]
MTLPLFPELHASSTQPATSRQPHLKALAPARPTVRKRHPVLWLCLRFPGWSLQALSGERDVPLVVLEGEGGMARVLTMNHIAARAGVLPGMRLSAALSRLDRSCLLHRSDEREQACLANAAEAAMAFTDRVSLLPGEGLLLEVRGSLRLFGGLEPLLAAVSRSMQGLGLVFRHAVAPTPLAAQYLARAAPATVVEDRSALAAVLGRLPLGCLVLDARTQAQLQGIGCRRLADVLRLPRDGLMRRFGPELSGLLDRALGRQPDPRPCWRGQLRFYAEQELPSETDRIPTLIRHCRPLLVRFCHFLRRHDSQVACLTLYGRTESGPALSLRLALLDSPRTADHLAELLAIRLESQRLEAPIREIELESSPLYRYQGRSRGLFPEAGDAGREGELLNRLRARLGTSRVYALTGRPCHDPAHSWQICEPGEKGPDYRRSDRPLWLLPRPRPISDLSAYRPLAGPERIETGWWESRDICRDYYRAIGRDGGEAWIFRDRRNRCWYLHGLFG